MSVLESLSRGSSPNSPLASTFRLAALGLLAGFFFVVVVPGAVHAQVLTPDFDSVQSQRSILGGEGSQFVVLKFRLDNDDGLVEDADHIMVIAPNATGAGNDYVFAPFIQNHSVASGWVIATISYGNSTPGICGIQNTCDVIEFRVGSGGSELARGTEHTWKINVTTPPVTTATTHAWRMRACIADNVTGCGASFVSNPQVAIEPVGVAHIVVHSPTGAVDALNTGSHGTLSQSQRVNFTVTVQNSFSATAVTFRLRLKGSGSGDLQEESGNLEVPAATSRVFEFKDFGFGYNFSSSTGTRTLNLSLVISTPSGTTSASNETVFTVITRPDVINVDTQMKYTGAACEGPNVPGTDTATISASTATGPTKSVVMRIRYKNTGQATAVNIDPRLLIYDDAGVNVTDKFTITLVSTPVRSLVTNDEDRVCFNIATNTVAPNVPPNGKYNVTVEVRYNDENTVYNAAFNGDAPETPCTSQANCAPLLMELRFAHNSLTVDSTPPSVSVVTIPTTVEFVRNGYARRDIRVTVSDDSLNNGTVNLTLQDGTKVPSRHQMKRNTGNDFNVTVDFADNETLATFLATVEAFDLANNRRDQLIGSIIVQDTLDPFLVSGPTCLTCSGGNLVLNTAGTFSAVLNDSFKLDPNNIFLQPLHLNGSIEEAIDNPIKMASFSTNADSNNGTYTASFTPRVSGQYRMKVWALDMAPIPHNITFQPFYLLNATNAVTLRLKPAGSEVSTFVFPASKNVSQAHPVRFGAPDTNTSGADNDPFLRLVNSASGSDLFQFSCELAPGNTLQGATACEITDKTELAFLAPDASTALPAPSPKANTVSVAMFSNSAGLGTPFSPSGTSLPSGESRLSAVVTLPPTARVGDAGRVNLTVFSKFFPAATSTVTLGFEVRPAHDVDVRVPGVSPSTEVLSVNTAKPGRQFTVSFLVENLGNQDTNFTVTNTTALTTANATAGEAWDIRIESSDPRYNPVTKNLSLSANGAPSLANQTTLRVVVTPPNDAASGPTTAPVVRHILLTVANATGNVGATGLVRINMTDPSVRVKSIGGANITASSNTTAADQCPLGPTPATACVFPHNVSSGVTPYVVMQFQVEVASSLNDPNPGSNTFLVPPPAVVLIAPDGSRENLPMTIVAAQGGTLQQGKNGLYQASKNLTDTLGLFTYFFDVRDVSGDFLVTTNRTFRISEPADGNPQGRITDLVVREEGDALVRQGDGSFRANYGANITVKLNLADVKANDPLRYDYMVGKATLKVFQVLDTGPVPAVPSEIAMTRTADTVKNGSKVTNATFEGTFRPILPASQGLGVYQFVVEAFDNQLLSAAQPANIGDLPFLVRLQDLRGPTFVFARMTGGSQSAENLDVEQNVSVLVETRVIDNGDGTPGSNVNPDSVRIRVTRGSTVVVNNLTMTRANATDYNHTLDTTALATVGTYTVQLCATDLTGAVSCATRTLQVLINLPPVLAVTSPPLVDGQRFASSTTPVTVTVNDANVDPNATGSIIVEVQTGGGNFTPVIPTISGSRPTLTVTVPITVDGNVTIRVTAVDTLGLSNTTTFSVRSDNTAPIAAISVFGADIGTRAHRPSASEPFFVSPSARLQVTTTETGSGVATVVVTVRPAGAGSPRTHTVTGAQNTFTLEDVLGAAATEGDYFVSARVTDRVGNAANATEVTVKLDSGAPTVATPIRPASPVRVTVTDLRSAVRSVEVGWSSTSTGSLEFFSLQSGAGNEYSGDFPPEAAGTVFFVVRATDNVGNVEEEQCGASRCQLGFGNRAPVVTLSVTSEGQAVSAGGTVRGEVSIGWTAQDPEQAQVLVTVKLRNAQNVERTLVADATLSPVPWDTTAEQDGAWTIVLEGSDGTLTNTTSLAVTVRNLRIAAEQPLPSNVNAGGNLLLAYEVTHPTKGVKSVVAVLRVGAQRENVTLFDDGTHGDRTANDGTWSATYTPRLRGQHTVDLAVTYDDDQQSTVSNVGTFQAQGGAAAAVASVTFFAAIIVGVAAAALGVFGLRRWP